MYIIILLQDIKEKKLEEKRIALAYQQEQELLNRISQVRAEECARNFNLVDSMKSEIEKYSNVK